MECLKRVKIEGPRKGVEITQKYCKYCQVLLGRGFWGRGGTKSECSLSRSESGTSDFVMRSLLHFLKEVSISAKGGPFHQKEAHVTKTRSISTKGCQASKGCPFNEKCQFHQRAAPGCPFPQEEVHAPKTEVNFSKGRSFPQFPQDLRMVKHLTRMSISAM